VGPISPFNSGNDNALEGQCVVCRAGFSTASNSELADFAILSKDPTAVEPTTIADIKVTETVKEGKTIFRLEPGARAVGGVPDIAPLLVAFGGHRGTLDGCAHDAMFRMARGQKSRHSRFTNHSIAHTRLVRSIVVCDRP
jgi:hypothetical protein